MKASIKTIMLSALSAIAAFATVTYSSCESDPCKAIVCANGGVCNDGSCTCPSGYEGTQCETVMRDKFIGVYVVLEDGSTSNTAQYTVSVVAGTAVTDLKIKNFGNRFLDYVEAYVKSDTVYIPQKLYDGRWEVQGTGIYQADPSDFYGRHGKLTLKYTVIDKSLPSTAPADDFGVILGFPSLWNK